MLRTHKMTTVKKTIMSGGERVGKLEPAYTAPSTQNSASLWRAIKQFLQKVNHGVTARSGNSTPGFIRQQNENNIQLKTCTWCL